jgi:DNA-binding response OmpR family regulator
MLDTSIIMHSLKITAMNPKLLLVTDRSDLARLQAQMLVHSGIEVSVLNHTIARSKMSASDLEGYDLIMLNMFDEESLGIEICRKLRAGYFSPILALIYESDERFMLRMYDAGADDCLVQPLSIHMLLAKVRAWLRQSSNSGKTVGLVEAYEFKLNPIKSEVITPEETLVRLSQLEARLLHLLIVNSGRIVSTDLIIQRVWPDNGMSDGDRHLLKALVHRLRRKIECDPTRPRYIHTIPHQGYSFRPEE